MADDRDDFQRGRSQPARQRGDGAAAQGQQRRAERQPRNDTHEAVKNSRGRHMGLGTSGGRIDVMPDEPGRQRRLRLRWRTPVACAVAPGLLAAAGLSAGGVGAREEKRVEVRLLGTVMMSLAWRWVSISRRLPWAQGVRLFSACGATYCTTNHLAAPRGARCTKESALSGGSYEPFLPRCHRFDRLRYAQIHFFGGMLAMRNEFRAAGARRQIWQPLKYAASLAWRA